MARRDLSSDTGASLSYHPAYQLWVSEWRKLLDVYEGAGGFLASDKPYLLAHPREWLDHSIKVNAAGDQEGTVRWDVNPNPQIASPKLKTRRKLARYENVAATLLDQVGAALFRKEPTRSFANPDSIQDGHPLQAFWENADGKGRGIGPVIKEFWTAAGVFGHMIILAERDGETGESPSQADAPPVIVCGYTPLDLPDWLTDDYGTLTSVRLLEAAPRTSFDEQGTSLGYQLRTVDATGWKIESIVQTRSRSATTIGQMEDSGEHGFGALPVVLLYARKRALTPIIGRSLLGDPQLYIDHYNLLSEVRELLRTQTFAILNVPIGERAGGAQAEMNLIGQTTGTSNILFSTNAAAYIAPPDTNVAAYHEHIDRLLRTIYRLAVVGWESDSKDVEAAESRKLKKEDLHQMLAGYAAECEDAEIQIARLVYRAAYGDSWEAQWEKDQPSIAYPDDFDVQGLADVLEEATAAMALELGETATREIKKRVAHKMLGGASEETLKQVDEEIESLEVKTLAEQEQETLDKTFAHDEEMAKAKAQEAA